MPRADDENLAAKLLDAMQQTERAHEICQEIKAAETGQIHFDEDPRPALQYALRMFRNSLYIDIEDLEPVFVMPAGAVPGTGQS